ncbi:MAG: hypothetical protein ACOY0R_01410 [Chloroflexota bacterium]
MKRNIILLALGLGWFLAGCQYSMSEGPLPGDQATPPITGPVLTTPTRFASSFNDIETLAAQSLTETVIAPETQRVVELTAVSSTQTAVHTPLALCVILPDGSYSNFTSQSIETLATLSLSLFDQLRPAVDLRQLLEQAGWQHYYLYSVTIEGNGSLTLQVDHLPEDAALYLDQGTLNFVSGEIPVDDWPRDVVLIIVR